MNGVQIVEHTEGDGEEIFRPRASWAFEGIVSKRVDAPYRSGPARSWFKIRNPKAPAQQRERSTVRSESLGPPKMVKAAAPAADSSGGAHEIGTFSVIAECR